MQTLTVALGERSYPIFVGSNLLSRNDLYSPHIHGKQVCIVTNETVAPIYLDHLKSGLNLSQVSVVVLPDGEAHKNLTT